MAVLKDVHYRSLLFSAIVAAYFYQFTGNYFDGFMGWFTSQYSTLFNQQWGPYIAHTFNSIFFAWVYAKYGMKYIPGPNIIKGTIFGVVLGVVVIVTMMIVGAGGGTMAKMMQGMPTSMMIGFFINHAVWGGFVGALYNDEHCLNKDGKKCCC